MYTAGAQHSSSRLSLWRPAPQEKLLLCVNVAAPEKRSHPAHGSKGRPRSWQRSARLYQALFFFSLVPGARWYPTLKPRQFFHTKTKKHTYVHTKTKISRTPRQTDRRSVFFSLHVAIRNSLRSNNQETAAEGLDLFCKGMVSSSRVVDRDDFPAFRR